MLRTDRVDFAIQLSRDELFRFGTTLIFIVGTMLFAIAHTDARTEGGVFAVGFFTEYIRSSYARTLQEIRDHHAGNDPAEVDAFLSEFEAADVTTKGAMLREMKQQAAGTKLLAKRARRGLGQVHQIELVKRRLLFKIAAAWIITAPVAAGLAAMFFYDPGDYAGLTVFNGK
ncbi:hypothetical protein [Yoonia sp.]|uniref:hypothetical protein n=1 Tax=Yoonia sp. TaxID=2212373 RepID=UPI0035C807FC